MKYWPKYSIFYILYDIICSSIEYEGIGQNDHPKLITGNNSVVPLAPAFLSHSRIPNNGQPMILSQPTVDEPAEIKSTCNI